MSAPFKPTDSTMFDPTEAMHQRFDAAPLEIKPALGGEPDDAPTAVASPASRNRTMPKPLGV